VCLFLGNVLTILFDFLSLFVTNYGVELKIKINKYVEAIEVDFQEKKVTEVERR